ncbi:efflux transporter outer membrane subunit [Edaphobacter dinghuensis]|uniref:Outer membrane efflux lipoprotein n=1 Tax=Edaphobacter dinghuensis TaxID=1560005 RepID=A0A917H1N9_9BACT|nr:efflux transporter outer membrane subunit [Edaphobacter dinghuensis]GGG64709.1 outer membrane efflux lipoprotein [Edaphobacter dinghuensis]
MSRYLIATSTLAALLLSGCMVGPKYTKPNVPLAPNYKESTAATINFKEDADWQPAQPADTVLRGDWWTIFNDPQLNELEPKVAAENQDLKAAEARFRQARALIQYNRSNLSPTIGVAPSATGVRDSANQPYFNAANANNGEANLQLPLDLNYEIDLWGRIRHGVNAAREEAQASAADMQTAMLSLQAELAIDYFEARSADAEEKLLQDTVKDYEDAYRITNNRFEGGVAPQSDVDQARTQLEAARVEVSDVTLQRAQYEHAIAVLIGQPPATFSLAATPLHARPPAIPVSLPSELLERRPDIAAAERRVAEANDRIGIARAAYFPTLSLNGAVGYESTALSNLLSRSSFLWAVGPTLSETFFDAGRRRSASEQALASYDETVANYRQTSLTAFQQVEDNLTALRVLNQEAAHQHQATQSAQSAQQIFNNRYVGGIDTYLQVVTAQTTALINERNDIDIMRRQMDASVLLIKALGGGWNTTNLPKL